jgi:hypothetical protein
MDFTVISGKVEIMATCVTLLDADLSWPLDKPTKEQRNQRCGKTPHEELSI